jgi:hypothetical protein
MGDSKSRKSRVGVSIWDREGNMTRDGKKSITFTVEETTMDELAKVFKDKVREMSE